MKIAVFGAGAIGSLLGALLSRKHHVTLIGRAEHVEAIQRSGLRIEGQEKFTAKVPASASAADVGIQDIVFVLVKAFNTSDALPAIRPIIGSSTILVTGQNGLGNWEALADAYPDRPVLAASITYGAFLAKPGTVQWNGSGDIVVGGGPLHKDAVRTVCGALSDVGLAAKPTDNVLGALWLKAIINASINPLTALHRIPNGRLLEDPRLHDQMRTLCREATAVAQALGVRLPVQDAWSAVEQVARRTAKNRSSMLQSVERSQRTEIEAITGQIVAAGRRAGIATPENDRVLAVVRRLDEATEKLGLL